jgi:formylglycine-generating enzyme required for sulfatase activity
VSTYGCLSPRDAQQRAARTSAQQSPLRRRPKIAVARGAAIDRAGARVLRGGSWNNNAPNCRAANRNSNPPDNGNHNVGFRLASTTSARIGLRP